MRNMGPIWKWVLGTAGVLVATALALALASIPAPILVLEAVGVALLALYGGRKDGFKVLYPLVIATAVLIATVFDPFAWGWLSILTPEETEVTITAYSIVANGTLGIVALIGYLLGILLHRKNTDPRRD